jgi:hypothetical protein
MVAVAGAELTHTPPVTVLVNDIVVDAHKAVGPVIAAGCALMVMVAVAVQPDVEVKVITDIPAFAPVTVPLAAPIVALVLLLVQVPVPVASASVVDAPLQMAIVPVIADTAFTFTVVVTAQPPAPV